MKKRRWFQIARKKKGLTQQTLAERVGCTRCHISLIEGGYRRPGIDLMSKIVKELDIPYELFLYENL